MSRDQEQSKQIQSFILTNVRAHPKDITSYTAQTFGITRQAVLRHIHKLIESGNMVSHGKTRDRHYELRPLREAKISFFVDNNLREDVIWRENLQPLIKGVKSNVREICSYGLTEMVNNVIDHAESGTLTIELSYYPDLIDIRIIDDGIGIFEKLQSVLGLDDHIHAVLELAKGKLTTDPEHHTGEGIFFTSRSFDRFVIASGKLFFSHKEASGDWLLEDEEEITHGTTILLQISPFSDRNLHSVFNKFSSDEDYGFSKTIVPVALARYGDENLISRSQAKRLLARFDRFKEIVLDFDGVDIVGQAFADEIFRVFQNQHPNIHLYPIRVSDDVAKMIERAKSRNGN